MASVFAFKTDVYYCFFLSVPASVLVKRSLVLALVLTGYRPPINNAAHLKVFGPKQCKSSADAGNGCFIFTLGETLKKETQAA